MKRVHFAAIVGAVIAIGLAPATSAFAQSEERLFQEQDRQAHEGEHHEGEGENGNDEHGEAAVHHPEPVNWTEFGGTRIDEHTHETKPNPPPFLAIAINFTLLAILLFMAVRRVINPALADRRTAVEQELNEAQRMRTEAEAMYKEYSERIAKMDDEFKTLREEFVRAGKAEFERVINEANARAERMQHEGEAVIAQEVRQLREDLLHEAVEAAVVSAEIAVRDQINAGDQARLADDYVAKLESTPKGAAA
jgi:F-type H+-transporting ATPase subunit b